MSEPTIVCLLGMHRSGSSLVARVLHVLGLDLGPEEHLIAPSPDNPTGYWESSLIKEVNDEILTRLGESWSEPAQVAPGWERTTEFAELRKRARDLIEADFSDSELWGFKDPRNSLTLPFWQHVLPPMRYVICLRNPVDVAASLAARKDDSVPFAQGIELWLTYARAALAATVGQRPEFVFYEDLMADPESVVTRLARFIGHEADAAEPEARAAIRVAMSSGLWHQRTTVPNVVDTGGLAFHVKALYLAMRQFVPGPESVGIAVLDLLAAYASDAGSHLAQLEADRTELERARERSQALNAQQAELERRLSESAAELQRAAKAHEEERGRRRELEAELEATHADAEEAPRVGALAPGTDSRLVAEIRARAQELIPSEATVLVAAKGEDALLRLSGCNAWHFPLGADGRYAGYHPAGDTAAIAHLEAMRARGGDYLLLPATTLWWLDHYRGLRRHLEDRYQQVLDDDDCAIYRLRPEDRGHEAGPIATLRSAVASLRTRSGRDPSILDWGTELDIADRLPELAVFAPPDEEPALPYLDGTADIVVLASEDTARIAEARRVAADAVIRVRPDSPDGAELEWLAGGRGGWGDDVCVTLLPDSDGPMWDATLASFYDTLTDGFAGELNVVAEAAALGSAGKPATAAGPRVTPIEVAPGASLAQCARAAAEAAERSIQVFVAAPAIPLPDWLPSILALISDRGPAVVGARIVSGEGALEEAGGVITPGGTRQRRGEGDPDPDRPEYCFVRRVDFCSPPLLATRREVFERLGGFGDTGVAPSGALVDFSLRAGRTGAAVYYQPQARIVSIRGGSQ